MEIVNRYAELEKRIPRPNLIHFQRMLSRIGVAGERVMLDSLRMTSITLSDENYQIPIGNEEDYHVLKGLLNTMSAVT